MTFAQWLTTRGANDEDLAKIAGQLPGVFELKFAFSAWGLGDETLERLGIDAEKAKADFGFNGLRALGLSPTQAEELNRRVCGTQTVEGAPHLKRRAPARLRLRQHLRQDRLAVHRPRGPHPHDGRRPAVHHRRDQQDHQPAQRRVGRGHQGLLPPLWELGLKANALYRDGCKLSQPLNSTADADLEDDVDEDAQDAEELAEALEEVAQEVVGAAAAAAMSDAEKAVEIKERIVHRPMRRRLPTPAAAITHKFNVAGHEGYLTVGLYDDGMPGELFITMAKEGSTIGGLMDSLGTATRRPPVRRAARQLVRKFTHQRFEPAGMTTNRDIPFAKSLVDYIFRWMGMEFIPGYREANAPKRPASKPDKKTTTTADSAGTSKKADSANQSSARRDSTQDDSAGAAQGSAASAASKSGGNGSNGSAPRPGGRLAEVEGDGDAGKGKRLAIDDPQIVANHQTKTSPLASISSKSSAALAAVDRQNASAAALVGTLNEANSQMMGDAPACDVCGSITVRNGTCYKCLNCGNSMGCS
jgi:ribonucleoside-diphosphate reductase alpha chain